MKNKLDKILTEVSAGELIDKITILEIKKIKISDKTKLSDVEKELKSLNQTYQEYIIFLNFFESIGLTLTVITPSFFFNSLIILPSGETIKEWP